MTQHLRERVRYELPTPGVARVVLDRPERRNAQDAAMLYAIDEAFALAVRDREVKVIVLAAEGPDFSSGHDLASDLTAPVGEPRELVAPYDQPGAEGWLSAEDEFFRGLCLRWRDLPTPTIASVQGRVIAGGLMLIWPCDLIVASEDASFSDPVVAFGVNGHEFFTHVWELGARRAKELLFTGEAMSAAEARAIGMVNRVVPRAELETATLELAERIARRPSFGLRLAKRAVNQSLDLQGQRHAIDAAYSLHHLGHAHNRTEHGQLIDPAGIEAIRRDARGRE
ncbi:MAG TPA: enoyl-CoA hydratase [Solirubrobacteraceae bacterium]|jgi:enoyl-CoA hydratase|nr:enoyl-CoA hydratase [Solirubrobacteraceae bacterium]